jgi:hypothetical protein
MSYGTIIQSGNFVAVAGPTTLKLRSDVDWIRIYDPVSANNAAAVGFEYYWQRGMADGTGAILFHGAASTVVNSGFLVAPLGFSLIDSSSITSASIAVAAGTNATQPVYTTANTGVLMNGGVVRVFGTAQTNLNGLDFSVDTVNVNVSFRLANAIQQVPGVVAGAAGFWKYVAPDAATYAAMYPGKRVIANITAANPGVITTLVDHGYTTGQKVRLVIEPGTGMEQLNGQLVTVTVVNASTFSIGIDTSGYTPFVFPIAGIVFTPSQVIPVGEDTAYANNLADATENRNYIGMVLGYDAAGTGLAPAGIAGQTLYWIAGKSENL